MIINDPANGKGAAPGGAVKYYKRDFWSTENRKFVKPHFRLEKVARIVNKITRGEECDLLDLGCGPATLEHLLNDNIRYHGIDIAIHDPAPNLIEADLLENPIWFNGKRFDVIVAQGVFEYVGTLQSQKFAEIADLLKTDGTFIVSYWNFGHRDTCIYEPFSNIQSPDDFRKSLARHFRINTFFPASHNWKHGMSDRWLLKTINRYLNMNIPLVSPVLAVEYLLICSPRESRSGGTRASA